MMSNLYFCRIAALLFIAGTLATSCIKFEDKGSEEAAADTLTTKEPAGQANAARKEITGAVYMYNDTTGVPEKHAGISAESTTPEELVEAVNKYTGKGNITLLYVKTSNDTLYVRVPNSDYLTRQMGTLGAHAYMATATYTLTEAEGIHHVHFDFEEGDHAAPGTYNRKSFKPEPIN